MLCRYVKFMFLSDDVCVVLCGKLAAKAWQQLPSSHGRIAFRRLPHGVCCKMVLRIGVASVVSCRLRVSNGRRTSQQPISTPSFVHKSCLSLRHILTPLLGF